VTLVQDSGYYIVVDTPSATDIAGKERMLEGTEQLDQAVQTGCSTGFSTRGLIPGQVQLVVQTHGHPDHFGQGNFFPNARHFFGSYEYTGDTFIRTELYQVRNHPQLSMIYYILQNNSMPLTPNTELWSTPGHTSQDLSVVVRHIPNMGTIAVVGLSVSKNASNKAFTLRRLVLQ
jgi:glyoxylase-like metal-dependent hydrolase (beta-lactamase superfamily II)